MYVHVCICQHFKSIFTCLLFLIAFSLSSLAQKSEKKKEKPKLDIHPSIEANYLVGGLINSDNFVFKSGIGAHLIADIKFSDKVISIIGNGCQ